MSRLLDPFLNLEMNDSVKNRILDTIQNSRINNVESAELTFNVFSLIIYPKKNEVLISNDVVAEEPEEIFSLDEFYEIVKEYKRNH